MIISRYYDKKVSRITVDCRDVVDGSGGDAKRLFLLLAVRGESSESDDKHHRIFNAVSTSKET